MRTQPTPNVNPTIDDSQALLSGCWWLISLKQALGQVESPWVEPTYFQFTRQATNYASQFPTDKQSRMDGSSTSPIASLDNQKLPLFKDMNWLPVIDYENMNIICVYWCVYIYICSPIISPISNHMATISMATHPFSPSSASSCRSGRWMLVSWIISQAPPARGLWAKTCHWRAMGCTPWKLWL